MQPTFRDILTICALWVGGSRPGGEGEGKRFWRKSQAIVKQRKNCIPCYLGKIDKKTEVLIESVILNWRKNLSPVSDFLAET